MQQRPIPGVPSRAFAALGEADQFALRRWLALARAAGFDDVKDLTRRPWPAALAGAVIGIYATGDDHASWLAVEQDGVWAVVSCLDGSVSRPVGSLRDALEIVWRVGNGLPRHRAARASDRDLYPAAGASDPDGATGVPDGS